MSPCLGLPSRRCNHDPTHHHVGESRAVSEVPPQSGLSSVDRGDNSSSSLPRSLIAAGHRRPADDGIGTRGGARLPKGRDPLYWARRLESSPRCFARHLAATEPGTDSAGDAGYLAQLTDEQLPTSIPATNWPAWLPLLANSIHLGDYDRAPMPHSSGCSRALAPNLRGIASDPS